MSARPRARAAALALAVLVLVAGCVGGGQRTHDANDVDKARGEALIADPWLDASHVTLTKYAGGTNDRYLPTTTKVYRDAPDGAVEQVLRDETARAKDAGWWPFYAQCDGVLDGPSYLHRGIAVVLARELPDGSLAQAAMSLGPEEFTIDATAANHDMVQPAKPGEVEVESVACLSSDGTGPDRVGEPEDLTSDW